MSGRSQILICRMKVKNSPRHHDGLNAWIRSSAQSFHLSLRANAPRKPKLVYCVYCRQCVERLSMLYSQDINFNLKAAVSLRS